MARFPRNYIPKYRLHGQSGQAIVTIHGQHYLLGPHDSPESHQKYNQLIAKSLLGWLPTATRAVAITPQILKDLVERVLHLRRQAANASLPPRTRGSGRTWRERYCRDHFAGGLAIVSASAVARSA
jgi:hypothetical protein